MGGEELRGGNAAEVAPVGPVAGGAESGVVVGQVLRRRQVGAVGKGDVVGGEALLGGGSRGDNENLVGAKTEEEDRTMAVGKADECAVEWLLQEMEMTNEGKGRRARWESFLLG